jgi:oxygen-independent coproporphyrinogen III oxidase
MMQPPTPFAERVKPIGFYPLPTGPSDGSAAAEVAPPERRGPSLLYLHIPFCKQRCAFCFFFDNLYRPPEWRTFFGALLRDMELTASLPSARAAVIEAIFIGGGSPNVLSEDEIGILLQTLRTRFVLAPGCEVTLEWYPGDQSKGKLSAALAAGVTRLSFGIQSFDADRSRRLRLRHTPHQSRQIIEIARAVGFTNINIDLITCLPGETPGELLAELRAADSFRAGSVSPNPLEVIPETPLEALSARTGGALSAIDRLTHIVLTRETLLDLGYIQQRFHNYHLPGKQHRYNRLSAMPWMNLIGVGPGAYGLVDGQVYVNHKDLVEYRNAVDAGRWPRLLGNVVPTSETKRSHVVTSLLEMTLSSDLYAAAFGTSLEDDFGEVIASQCARGLLDATPDGLFRLTPLGSLWGDNVCLEYFSAAQAALLGIRFADGESARYGYHYAPAAAAPGAKLTSRG